MSYFNDPEKLRARLLELLADGQGHSLDGLLPKIEGFIVLEFASRRKGGRRAIILRIISRMIRAKQIVSIGKGKERCLQLVAPSPTPQAGKDSTVQKTRDPAEPAFGDINASVGFVYQLPIGSIIVGERHRKDLGDVNALADSIRLLGVLQPVVVTSDYRLVAGRRRLEAVRKLGWPNIPVRIATNLNSALLALTAERDENTCRKDFAPSEAVSIGKALEELEKPKAKERQREHGGTAPGKAKDTGGKFPPVTGKTRDKVAEAVGMSGRTYEKAKAVVEAAEEHPELQPVVEEMDRTGKVDPAFKKAAGRVRGSNTALLECYDSIYNDAQKVAALDAAWKSASAADRRAFVIAHQKELTKLLSKAATGT